MKKVLSLLCGAALCLSLADCGDTSDAAAATPAATEDAAAAIPVEYDLSGAVDITFSQSAVTAGDGVETRGTKATVTAPGAYRISGESADGQLWVDVDKTESVTLYLDGLSLRSADSCPFVMEHGLVTVVLLDGTENSLTDAADYALSVTKDNTNVDGALFSKDSLTIKGEGSLTVTGSYQHGVVCKDALTLEGGSLTVTCVQDGLQANEGLTVTGGSVTVTAGDDGMHSDSALTISGGRVAVLSSCEGLEGANITISGGNVRVRASDDGLNAAGGADSSGTTGRFGADSFAGDATKTILISGGTLFVDADGDGIDSNGSLTVTGGVTLVSGPTSSANGALDFGTEATVSGGVVMAAGAAGMAESFADTSAQGSIMVSVAGQADATVALVDSGGTALCAFTPTKAYETLVVSCPGIQSGQTYTVATGTVATDENGYAENAVITDPATLSTVEMTSLHYSEGGMGGFGGFGGKGKMPSGDGTRPTMPEGGVMPSPPADGTRPEGTRPDGTTGATPPDGVSGATPSASPTTGM